jgi:hypothetical protein
MESFRVPAARADGLIVTRSHEEVLVYDTGAHHIHHLNHLSAAVWRLCDGQRTVGDLARLAQIEVDGVVTVESVELTLTKLSTANLLDGEIGAGPRGTRQSRRAFLRRSAIAGAVAVPVVISISAPQAAAATSVCLSPGQCNASTVGQRCGANPGQCEQFLRCWQVPIGPPSYYCGSQPD